MENLARRRAFAMATPRAKESGAQGIAEAIGIAAVDTLSGFAVAGWSEGPFVGGVDSLCKHPAGPLRRRDRSISA